MTAGVAVIPGTQAGPLLGPEAALARPDGWPAAVPLELIPGVLGDFVRLVAPATESDCNALVFQALAGCGAMLGRETCITVEADRHAPAEFVLLLGGTGEGKGTSWSWVRRLLREADPGFTDGPGARVLGGVGSGEGVIAELADTPPPRRRRRDLDDDDDDDDDPEEGPAPKDRRLLLVEPEFSRPLQVMGREGSTLSAILRQAFDGSPLSVLTRKDPLKAPASHVAMVAHCTPAELRKMLRDTDVENGLLNRFVLVMVRRSRMLPWGGQVDPTALEQLGARLREAVRWSRVGREIAWSREAARGWESIYPALVESSPGLLGAYRARGRTHVLRLALTFACLDCSPVIERQHLVAAAEMWRYAEDSARLLFGTLTGDELADTIAEALAGAGADGLTRAEVYRWPGLAGHRKSAEIAEALRVLESMGLAVAERTVTGGRPIERWRAPAQRAISAKRPEVRP